jgi:integrase
MTVLSVLDAAGRRLSPATLPGYHAGRPPRNKGIRYPADPPTLDEIVAVHQLRHAHALELAREGVPLNIIQRQLGHANLGTTSIYLQGIDPEEIIATVHMRRAPMMSASAGLRL